MRAILGARTMVGPLGIERLMSAHAAPRTLVAIERLSLAKAYSSWKELKADSTFIVIGTAGKQDVAMGRSRRGTEYPEWTLTSLKVEQVVHGSASRGSSLIVKQHDGASADGSSRTVVEGSQLLTSGKRYLLFLVPSPTDGQYYVVGVYQGLFGIDSAGLVDSVSLVPPGVAVHHVPLASIVEAIKSA